MPLVRNQRNHENGLIFDSQGTPEALDERNPYSLTSRSQREGSPGPGKKPQTPKMGSAAWRSLLNYTLSKDLLFKKLGVGQLLEFSDPKKGERMQESRWRIT